MARASVRTKERNTRTEEQRDRARQFNRVTGLAVGVGLLSSKSLKKNTFMSICKLIEAARKSGLIPTYGLLQLIYRCS